MLVREVFRFAPGVNPFQAIAGVAPKSGIRAQCLKATAEEEFAVNRQGLGETFELIASKMSIGDLGKPRAILKAWDTDKKYRIYSDPRSNQYVVELYTKRLGEKNLLQTATRQERELLLDPLQAALEAKGEKPGIIKSYKESALKEYRSKREAKMGKQITADVEDFVKQALKTTFEKPKEEPIPTYESAPEVGQGTYQQRVKNLRKIDERKVSSARGRSRLSKIPANKRGRGQDCA